MLKNEHRRLQPMSIKSASSWPRPADRPPLPYKKILILIISVLVAGLCSHSLWTSHVTAQQIAAERHQQVETIAKRKRFNEALQTIRTNYPGVEVSVAIATSDTGQQLFGSTTAYDAASEAKLLTAAVFLQRVQDGQAQLQQQLEGHSAIYWLRAMVIDSDDDAWAVLNGYLGHAALTAYAKSVGMTHYDADQNRMTASDMTLLLHQLVKRQLLDGKRTTLILALMQKANYRDYIVAAVPQGYRVCHKVGFTDGNLHDTAIITKDNSYLVLTIFTGGNAEDGLSGRDQLMQQITRAALATYF